MNTDINTTALDYVLPSLAYSRSRGSLPCGAFSFGGVLRLFVYKEIV